MTVATDELGSALRLKLRTSKSVSSHKLYRRNNKVSERLVTSIMYNIITGIVAARHLHYVSNDKQSNKNLKNKI